MRVESADDSGRAWSRAAFWTEAFALTAILACSINHNSLWIDEGFTAWAVSHPSITTMFHDLNMPGISAVDRQYPLYDIYLWSWCRLFGTSEYALRMANLPFGFCFVVSLAYVARKVFAVRWWMPAAVAPFAFYYMNEARPYAMLMGLSSIAVAALLVYLYGERQLQKRAAAISVAAFVVAFATHVLALLVVPAAAVIVLGARIRRPGWRPAGVSLLIAAPLVAALVVYYGATIASPGAARAEVVLNSRPTSATMLATIAYGGEIVYEQLGLAGLGPPRNVLRRKAARLGPIAFVVPVTAAAVLFAAFVLRRHRVYPSVGVLLLAWCTPVVLAIVAANLLHARFLGRHLAAAFPVLAVAMVTVCRTRAQAVMLTFVFVASDARLAALPAYAKDDYRGAVRYAVGQQASGARILWAADTRTALYYGLDVGVPGNAALTWHSDSTNVKALSVANDCERQLASTLRFASRRHGKAYLILSKPDLYDRCNGLRAYVGGRHAPLVKRFSSFDVYGIDV